jgi:predicted aspartyl protease
MRLQRRQVLAGAAGLALAPVIGRAQPVASAPFILLNGKMFVDVTVNGVKAQAFVDSGADATGLDDDFAQRAGVKLGRAVSLHGIQGRQDAHEAKDVRFAVGAAVVTGRAIVLDYSTLAGQVRHQIDAVVGGDIFTTYVVEIDFEGQTLALHDRASFQPPAAAKLVPLTPKGKLMTAELMVEDKGPIRALIDLGDNVPLIVSPGPARSVGLTDGRATSTRRLGGHGPASIAKVTTAHSLSLAGERFDNVPVLITPHSIGLDANLGLPILQRFRLYLDFGGRRMWLGAANSARNEPFLRDRTGLEADIDGDTLKVAHVAKASPAEAGGWRVGDVITQIDGEVATSANLSLSLSAHPGQKVEFTLADGSKRSLTLVDYY